MLMVLPENLLTRSQIKQLMFNKYINGHKLRTDLPSPYLTIKFSYSRALLIGLTFFQTISRR
jgi:hypothetical protein